MKKLLLQLVLLLLPFFALAQNDAPILKDFAKKAWGTTTTFQLNDHVSIIQTWVDKEGFELAAIDNKMQVLWRNKFEGYPIGAGKFGDHILAISADKYRQAKDQAVGPYTAVLLDEKTGRELTKKIIYDSKSDIQEFPDCYFNTDGSSFTFVVWQAKHSSWMFGFPTVAKLSTIDGLSVVKLDATLSPTVSKLKFPDEDIMNFACNSKGDVFLTTHPRNARIIKVTKYDAPKYEAKQPIVQNIDAHSESDLNYKHGVIVASEDNRNVLYMALIHSNENKDDELTVSKFDFDKHIVNAVNEVFNKSHIKEIENSYVPFDKNLDKPEIELSGLKGKYITERNGTLLVVLPNLNFAEVHDPQAGTSSGSGQENSFIINGYDTNLSAKFQQLMPTYRMGIVLSTHGDGNSFYMLASTSDSGKPSALFGQLDLSNGKWLKLRKLSKEKFDRKAAFGSNIMWFADSFIIPYDESFGISNISLQLNGY